MVTGLFPAQAEDSAARNSPTYRATQGINIETSLLESFQDVGVDVTGHLGDVFGTMKWFGVAVSAVVLVTGGLFLYNIAKNPVEAGKVALSMKKP